MNFEHDHDRLFEQYCLELAKLLRTEQTENFLQFYDNLPSEWNGSRNLSVHEAYLQLETAKEYIRQLQELDENEFEFVYRRGIDQNEQQQIAMSDLSGKSAVIQDDDDGEQTTTTTTPTNKGLVAAAASGTSRITSPLIIKRQQNIETITANDQAYDEIHDVPSRHSPMTKMNNEDSHSFYSSKQKQSSSDTRSPLPSGRRYQPPTTTTTQLNSGNNLMQGNYYDRTSSDVDCFVPMNLSIDVEQYKKTIAPVSSTNSSSSRSSDSSGRTITQQLLPPFGDTSESIQQGIAQSAVTLLEPSSSLFGKKHHHQKSSMKTNNNNNNTKSHERVVFDYYPKDTNNEKQRSLSASSSSSSSLTNDCSTSDSSTTDKHQRQQTGKSDLSEDLSLSNIPYQLLVDDDDDDDHSFVGQTIQPKIDPLPPSSSESMVLLNKNPQQTISTYGTHLQTSTTTNVSFEHSKLIPNNGYNSHGSSTTTKSSSDNSGSVRTGSGSDIDEESDEEHHARHHRSSPDMTMKKTSGVSHLNPKFQRTTDSKAMLDSRNKPNNDNINHMPETDTYQYIKPRTGNDEPPLVAASQVPRFKQPVTDDPNGNTKLTSDASPVPYASQWSQQQSPTALSNTLPSSSSHHQRNPHEQQQQNHHSGLPRNSRQSSLRAAKKRKQQQQDIIRTESIPGHRGDLDVDDLVMFIDGDSSSTKQQQRSLRQNSGPLRPTDTNTLSTSNLTDGNSNGNVSTSSRRKSRKPIRIVPHDETKDEDESNRNHSINENEHIERTLIHLDEDTQSIGFIDEDDELTTHSNQQNASFLPDDDYESQSNIVEIDSANDSNTTNGEPSLPDLLETVRSTSPIRLENGDYSFSSSSIQRSNSEIISEPFVTVTHRRRSVKERRQQDNNQPIPPSRASRFPASSQDKRRFPSTQQNGLVRPSSTRQGNFSQNKSFISTITTNKSNPLEEETTISSLPSAPSSNISNEISSISDKQQSSPRLSSHSSSSSLSSLLKRQSSKFASQPPVVFLNKSADIELNGVSFGFDVDCSTLNPLSEQILPDQPVTTEEDEEPEMNPSSPLPLPELISQISSSESNNSNSYISPQKYFRNATGRPFMQRNQRASQFYTGSDIRPSLSHSHHQDNRHGYSQPVPPPPPQTSSYIDPLFLLQYSQQRFANYSQQIAYMNLFRAAAPAQFLSAPPPPPPPQSVTPQYVFLPANYTEQDDPDFDEKTIDDETIPTADQQQQQPLLIYATIPTPTAPMFFHPHQALAQSKKQFLSNLDLEQQQQSSIPTLYAATQGVYPSPTHLFYPQVAQQQSNALHTAYFQPISSTHSPLTSSESDHHLTRDRNTRHSIEHPNDSDDEYENSSILIQTQQQQQPPPSSHIMSNALQLVYSEERRNMQAGRFNLDQLTSYLAMKWMDTVDRFEQGDTRIILTGER